MNKERRIGQNITFVSGDMEPDRSWFRHTKRALHHRVAECALNKSSLLCFDFCVKLRLCYSINDDVTLGFFWFKFAIFYQTRNDTNLTQHGVLAEFLLGNFYCCFFCPVLVVTWCACRVFFVSVLFIFSKLYSFKLERIQHNINVPSRTVLLLALFFLIHVFLFCFFVWFLGWGWGGALAFIKKTGVWGSILLTIYVLVYYILFVHCLQLWLLSLNAMCCGLQLVLWFHLLALLNLGSRLQGFIWRSADKVPAWKSEQLLVPCNWWHPLGACWSVGKTKPLQTSVKCSLFFCRIKVAWRCRFAWEQMID